MHRVNQRNVTIAVENGELKVHPSDFFIPSTYINTQNKDLGISQEVAKGDYFSFMHAS